LQTTLREDREINSVSLGYSLVVNPFNHHLYS
jgi:hypothetical protein